MTNNVPPQAGRPANAPQPSQVNPPRRTQVADDESPVDFVPSADEVARRAYFSYVNEGSLPGRDVQHWLEAEAHLLRERNRTRAHGFYHKT
jgi:Protein of unknown function (DUF2934)